MRRQDHGKDDYRDYFNNLANQYLVWPTITLGVHIYIHATWHRVRGFSAWFMEYIWTRTERKEECLRREIFYVTWPAKLYKELSWHVFVRGEDMCRNFYRPRHAWGHRRVRLKVLVQHDKTEEGMFDGFQPAWVRDEYNIRNIRWPVHMYFTRMRRLRK